MRLGRFGAIFVVGGAAIVAVALAVNRGGGNYLAQNGHAVLAGPAPDRFTVLALPGAVAADYACAAADYALRRLDAARTSQVVLLQPAGDLGREDGRAGAIFALGPGTAPAGVTLRGVAGEAVTVAQGLALCAARS